MAKVGRRTRGYRVAGQRPTGVGLRTPEAARWWQVRKRRRQRPGARRVERGSGWDWGKFAAAITSLTAIAALLFTGLSLQQTREQNQLAESGQITDRFNAAITNLGSGKMTIRIGGIYALQRIMQDSPRDQPAVIQVLAAFVRGQAPLRGTPSLPTTRAGLVPAIDVQTVLAVLAARDPADDDSAVIDLNNTDLTGANLNNARFKNADLYDVRFANADFTDADLTGADLFDSDLTDADLSNADLTSANLIHADLADADLSSARLVDVVFQGANLQGANLALAHLDGVEFGGADLAGAGFVDVDLNGVDLKGMDLVGVQLAGTSWCPGGKPNHPGGYLCH